MHVIYLLELSGYMKAGISNDNGFYISIFLYVTTYGQHFVTLVLSLSFICVIHWLPDDVILSDLAQGLSALECQ